jgi:hypothetical protein
MWLFDVDTGGNASASDSYSKGQGFLQQLKEINTAFQENVLNLTNMTTPMENMVKAFTHMEDSANAISRSMGGVVYEFQDKFGRTVKSSQELQNKLMASFKETEKMGASFDDSSKSVAALATGMGRMVDPSKETIVNMVALQKTTNMTAEEVGGMVTDMVRFGGTQEEATETMAKLAQEARKVGVNTKAYMKDVSTNMKLLNGFGFKTGIEGVKKMAKEAAALRSSIEKIGATKFQSKILDPEGAIEAAANMQMLGGAVGKLADPFQLMHMAQSDMAGLQTELLNATKSAFKFNKETGGFEASTEDLYRLRQMAEATGADFDGLVEAGKEAQKLDYIKDKFNLGTLTDEQKGLVAGLAQIDKGGKVSIDLPGYEEGNKSLETMLKDPEFANRLTAYQELSMKSEKDIAVSQLSLAEEQLAATNTIKNAVVLGLSTEQRSKLYKTLEESNATAVKAMVKASEAAAVPIGNKTTELIKNSADILNNTVGTATGYGEPEDPVQQRLFLGAVDAAANIVTAPLDIINSALSGMVRTEDLLIPSSGQAPRVMSAGKIYEGIVGDEVAMGVGVLDGLNKVSSGQGAIGGKLDININVGGQVNGDDRNQISKIFDNPQVQKQIMDTVLYKLESYKKQQGVLA